MPASAVLATAASIRRALCPPTSLNLSAPPKRRVPGGSVLAVGDREQAGDPRREQHVAMDSQLALHEHDRAARVAGHELEEIDAADRERQAGGFLRLARGVALAGADH